MQSYFIDMNSNHLESNSNLGNSNGEHFEDKVKSMDRRSSYKREEETKQQGMAMTGSSVFRSSKFCNQVLVSRDQACHFEKVVGKIYSIDR